MTQDLAQSLTLLVRDLAGADAQAMQGLRQVDARLPMEFGLARSDNDLRLRTRPPAATQSRDLAVPSGSLRFTLDVSNTEGADDTNRRRSAA